MAFSAPAAPCPRCSSGVVASACSRRSTSFAVSACAFVTVATIDAFCASARASMIFAFSRIFASSASRTPFAARSFAFAFASLRQIKKAPALGQLITNYRDAVHAGILKVMSKMGISCLHSYT